MKKQFIKDIKTGTQVDDIFYCAQRDVKQRRDGGSFLTFELRDKTGSVAGIMWDRIEDALKCVETGGFYRVQGRMGDYQGKAQLTVNIIYPADKSEVSRDDFIATSRYDREKMMAELSGYVSEVKNKHLKAVLDAFFGDPKFSEQFSLAPGGARVHHAYLSGLLEHTVTMCRLGRAFPEVYQEIDPDLLLTGIILHDVGKVREYVYDIAIDHSYDGRLLGHITMGFQMVQDKLATIKGFPPELGRMLLHIILAHHGQMDFGSPKTPKFSEAYIVYFLDNLDARVAMFRETVEKNPKVKWTDFHQYLETNVYIPDKPA